MPPNGAATGREQDGRQDAEEDRQRWRSRPRRPAAAKPKLLAGGNPQIAKAEGDAAVQAWIAAMPGWKRETRARSRRADRARRPGRAQGGEMEFAAVRRRRPRLVPRHSLLHEIGQGGFLPRREVASGPSRRVAETRTRATSTSPRAPELDEAQLAAWVKQASRLPGVRMWSGDWESARGVHLRDNFSSRLINRSRLSRDSR